MCASVRARAPAWLGVGCDEDNDDAFFLVCLAVISPFFFSFFRNNFDGSAVLSVFPSSLGKWGRGGAAYVMCIASQAQAKEGGRASR